MRANVKLAIAITGHLLAAGPGAAQEQSNEPPLADSKAAGVVATARAPIMDFVSLVRGTANAPNAAMNKDGAKTPRRECPSCPIDCFGCPNSYGSLTIGPSGTQNFLWQINNATGVGGPSPDANNQISGWEQLHSVMITNPITHQTSVGNLFWTATSAAGSQFQFALQTLMNPTTVGQDNPGPMANFNPAQSYMWPFVTYVGPYIGPSYSGPGGTVDQQLTADTLFDTTGFANPIQGTFSLHLDQTNKLLDVVYTTSVPEPGTLGLVAVGLLGVWRASRRRGR